MRPREFIEALKQQHPVRSVRLADLPATVLAELQERGVDPTQMIDSQQGRDHFQSLANELSPKLSPELRTLFTNGNIAVGTIGLDDFGAYTQAVEGGHAIVFHRGLIKFIYRIARILSTRVNVMDKERDSPDLPETARLIAEAFWWLQETGRAFGPDYPVTPEQLHFANLLALDAETFLLAHELGHVVVDLRPDSEQRFGSAYEIEHAADLIGLSFALELNSDEPKDTFRFPMQYAGAEFVLQIFDVLSQLGFSISDSHPAAANRIIYMRTFMQSKCNDEAWTALTQLADFFAHIFGSIRDILLEPAAHAAFYERQAQEIVDALDVLLTRCTGGFVPDYSTFSQEAGPIFDQGYPHEILKIAALVAGRFFSNMSIASEADKKQRWIDFQKFKLLLNYCRDHMPEPARSLFLRELGFPEYCS